MWIQLTAESLLTRVSSNEQARLNRAAVSTDQDNVLGEIAQQVASDWRSGLRKVTTVDTRTDYVPDELISHILAHFRYAAYTRLPGMGELLDDLRVKEWDRANTVRDNLIKHSVQAPDAAYAETTATSGKPGPAIAEPEPETVL